jgi:class 3 adenylate cyclase
MERRLAAILAADVAGYSRLMERDEAGTLEALKSRRRNISPALRPQGGFIGAIEVANPAFDARPMRAPPQR